MFGCCAKYRGFHIISLRKLHIADCLIPIGKNMLIRYNDNPFRRNLKNNAASISIPHMNPDNAVFHVFICCCAIALCQNRTFQKAKRKLPFEQVLLRYRLYQMGRLSFLRIPCSLRPYFQRKSRGQKAENKTQYSFMIRIP